MKNSPRHFYEFGPFRLDPAEHSLLRDGQTVLLTPKVFEILKILVEGRGHLFEKDELMKAIWPDSFVEEGSLTRNISTLRSALGENADEHKYIETVPKRGYRFVAPVREVRATSDDSNLSQSRIAGTAATHETSAPAIDEDGTIRDRAAHSKTRLRSYRAVTLTVLALLGLTLLAYGLFVRRRSLASEPKDRSPAARPLKSFSKEANDDYLRAKSHRGLQNQTDTEAAIALLERAIQIDPQFAAAHAELALEYRNQAFALKPRPELEEKAFAEVEKALDLDPDLAEGHLARGELLWTHSNHYPHEVAAQEFRRALDLDPNLDEAHHELAIIYIHIGLLDKADEEIKKTLSLNPGNTGARNRVGVILQFQCKYQQALDAFTSSGRYNPTMWAHQTAWVLFQLGRRQEAAARINDFLKEYPQDEGGVLTGTQALMAAAAGDEREANLKIAKAAEIGKGFGHFHHTAYLIASAYALMNKHQEAIEWMQKAADDGFPCYPLFKCDPNLANLRQDPQFIAFMARLEEKWKQSQARL